MILRISLIIFSTLGLLSSFMPWVYYPQADASLYGYTGDGIVSGFVFLVLIFYSLLTFRKNKFPKTSTIVMIFLAILMVCFSYSKITGLQFTQENFDVSNPFISKTAAGLQIGYGLYVLGASSIITFLLLLGAYFSKPTISQAKEEKVNIKLLALVLIPVIFLVLYLFLRNPIPSAISKEDIEISLTSAVNQMGESLKREDYDAFVEYSHLSIVQSLGGKEQVKRTTKEAIEGLASQGAKIEDISLGKVLQSENQDKELQVIIEQNTIFRGKEGETSRTEKMLAISQDMGRSWKFINLTGKTQQQIIEFYPKLSKKLKI